MPTKFDALKIPSQFNQGLVYIGDQAKAIDYADLGQAVISHAGNHVQEHPYRTPFELSTLALSAGPASVVGPMAGMFLKIFGFSRGGVVAKSLAAAQHSKYAPVAATSMFATLQSAGAGGYGTQKVATAVRAGAGVASSIPWVGAVLGAGKDLLGMSAGVESSKDDGGEYNGGGGGSGDGDTLQEADDEVGAQVKKGGEQAEDAQGEGKVVLQAEEDEDGSRDGDEDQDPASESVSVTRQNGRSKGEKAKQRGNDGNVGKPKL